VRSSVDVIAPPADVTRDASAPARRTATAFLVRLSCFLMFAAVWYIVVIGLAALASPRLQANIMKISNIPLGFGQNHIALRFKELQDVRDIDILFIGSSHSLRTFDPRYFESLGIRAFNLGTSSQTPLNTYFLLQHYLSQLKPRLVVVESYWETLAINGVEGTIFITGNRGPSWDTLRMALATRDPMALHAQVSSPIERVLRRTPEIRLHPAEVYTSGGYLERWDSNTEGPRRPRDIPLDGTQLTYLSRSLTLLRDRQVKTLLTWAPVTSSHRHATTNLEEIRTRMMELSETHDVPFVDLQERVALDDHLDFFDDNHLNQRGVDKVMPVFVRVLREFHLLREAHGRLEISR
jgi:hypothetical protein